VTANIYRAATAWATRVVDRIGARRRSAIAAIMAGQRAALAAPCLGFRSIAAVSSQ
jgi:hypothetical protein